MLSNAAAGDLAALARGARELAAIAGDIGARRMCDLAASLEAACRRRGTEEAEALARDLVEIVAQTAAELRLRYLRDAV
jgi:HPt (histidine-containing phosphotransfer) domain-containing protein